MSTEKTPAPDSATVAAPEGASTPTVDAVTARLTELGVPAELIVKIKDLGAESVNDLAEISVSDLTSIGMKPIPAKKLVAALKLAPATAATDTSSATAMVPFQNVLPPVPTDESWLTMLRAGGVLKVDQSTVISAVRAALGERVGLFGILDKVIERIEQFADSNEEPVGPEFFKLRKQMTRRDYAEIFSAIEGFDGKYVTEGRKKQLYVKINQILWPAIIGFNEQLKAWQASWMQGAANPAMMMNAIATLAGGGGMMPPGMMTPPRADGLRDYAIAVNDAINKVFSGTGVQIAAAIAYDATKIRETMENRSLPALMGFANRDQMLRQLGVAVPVTYARLENDLTQYVLSIMQVEKLPSGNQEIAFFGALYTLGMEIPWDQLDTGTSRKPSGLGETPRSTRY